MSGVRRDSGRKGRGDTTTGFTATISRFSQRSYVADYAGFILLLIAYTLIEVVVEPFHRMFALDWTAIQYPHAKVERVSVFWNVTYCVFLPLCVFVLWTALFRPGVHKVNVTILGFAISVMLSAFLTDVVKNGVGRPRPDLIARCKPKKGTPQHTLVIIDVCTEKNHHTLHDGWRSFPSGHSSLAFSGLGFVALFFAGQMHVFRPRTDFARVLLALAPLVGAALIAISRLEDYRHDVYDVTVGSSLGILVAYFSYRRYYPSLKSARCDTPHPSRAEVADSGYRKIKGKIADEEERIESSGSFSLDDVEDDAEQVHLQEASTDRSGGRFIGDGGG